MPKVLYPQIDPPAPGEPGYHDNQVGEDPQELGSDVRVCADCQKAMPETSLGSYCPECTGTDTPDPEDIDEVFDEDEDEEDLDEDDDESEEDDG